MHPSLQPLVDGAFHRAQARDANAAIADARDLAGGEEPFSYEVVCEPEKTLAELGAKILPRLVYHLDSRGARAPAFEGVFLSLFLGDALYFIHARDAVALLGQAVGRSVDELVESFGTGELRRALEPGEAAPAPRSKPGELLLLPGSKPK